MTERLLLGIAAILAGLVLGLGLFWHPQPAPRAIPPAAQSPGGDFILQSAAGPVALKDFRGKVVLVYFGYTYCPDICPTSLAAIAAGLKRLRPEEQARVAMIFISVDPERDSPARLREYAEFFHPSIVGVTGTAEELAEIAKRYGAFFSRQKADTAGGYVVDHTADTYVVAADGRLVGHISHAAQPEQVVAEIRRRLN